ncbi:hypothetical protein [Salinimicrobium sediminilitoris]|uniref:hypothetical protein n=1 Tax=Salinimicrobium sediminilitoris TaxID=2876715 RepID=UPI001E2F3F1A|nr:hypothetical protein [Salinimicrobium sediminilitoris]MCC8360986.1 hypothetical protein [Salinimicrobium sediminilitoris]
MLGRNLLFPLLLLFSFFTSCKNEPEVDDNLWVGTIRVIDHNIPFPFLLEKTKTNLRLIDHENNIIDSSSASFQEYQDRDTIKMQDHRFLVMNNGRSLWLLDQMDSLNFHYEHPMYAAQFVKAAPTDDTDFSSLSEQFQNITYQTEVNSAHFATPNRDLKIEKTLAFSEDSLTTTFNYFYQNEFVYAERELSKYDIFERKGKVFLSEGQDKPNSVNLYLVTEIDENSFSLRSFRNNEEYIEQFENSEAIKDPSNFNTFERCMEGQPGEYYHDNLTFNKGNEYLIQKISKNAPKASGDGYITVHFTINCKGEMGHLGLKQMDREFQSTSFDPVLVKHIISEVMDLKDWPEIKSGKFYRDIHSFLMFRIRNGKITDLCP